MRYGRPDLVGTVPSRIVNLAVIGAVRFEERDVAGGAAHRLRNGVDGLDGVVKRIVEIGVVRGGVVRIHSRGVWCDGGKRLAQHWVAGDHVAEASSVAVASGEDSARIHTIACRQVRNQCFEEANIVDICICPAVRSFVVRVGSQPIRVAVDIDHNAIWVQTRIAESGLRFNVRRAFAFAREREYQRRRLANIVVLRNVYRIVAQQTIGRIEVHQRCRSVR